MQLPSDPGAPIIARPRLYNPDLKAVASLSHEIAGDEAHHAARVRRVRVGDLVHLFDGKGGSVEARVQSLGPSKRPALTVEPIGPLQLSAPLAPAITIAAPPPKPDRHAQLIEQLSQIGAAAWLPLSTEFAQHTLDEKKLAKLERIAIESAKQCGRSHLLHIMPPAPLETLLEQPNLFAFDQAGQPAHFSPPPPDHATVLIGPEGGFSPAEFDAIKRANVPLIRAGAHVLRLETAAAVAAALLLAHTTNDSNKERSAT